MHRARPHVSRSGVRHHGCVSSRGPGRDGSASPGSSPPPRARAIGRRARSVWSSRSSWGPDPGEGLARQPGACLAWLHASQRPWPLSRAGGAAARRGRSTWSRWRIGASHHGVRQLPVAQLDEPARLLRKPPGPGVHGHQLAGRRAGVEPPDPATTLLARAGAGDDLAGQLGGDGAVALDVRRLVAGAEQRLVGHRPGQRDQHASVAGHVAAGRRRRRPGRSPPVRRPSSWPRDLGSPAARRRVGSSRSSAA